MTETELLMPSKIVYSSRRSISLIIESNGDLIVRAPVKCKDKEINKFIKEKASWIIKKRIEAKNNQPQKLEFGGGEITILGKEYTLIKSEIARIKAQNNLLYVPVTNSEECLIKYLKKELKKHLVNRVKEIAEIFDFSYKSISISSAKTNWGSCSGNNKLHFTYKLALCPLSVIDYIIVHELTHTVIKNHSQKFWTRVKLCMPNYKLAENWLKQNRGIITLI